MSLKDRFAASWRALTAPGTERGVRTTDDERLALLYASLTPDMNLRATINGLRSMDEKDSRVKTVHERTSRAATKGGLRLRIKQSENRSEEQPSELQSLMVSSYAV